MSSQPKSRSVSLEDKPQANRPACAESSRSNQDHEDNLSDTPTSGETGIAKMTPSEFGWYNCRIWHMDKINVLLRDICFRGGIVDRLPEVRIARMDKSFEFLYAPFHLDRKIFERLPGPPNKALRWRLMGQIWRLLCLDIFDQLKITNEDKDPEADPIRVRMRDMAAEQIKRFMGPFKATDTAEAKYLNSKIDEMVDVAKLFSLMLHHDSATYSFFILMDQNFGKPLLRYSEFTNMAEIVEICGASHRDASGDRIGITATAGLMRTVGDRRLCMKKAGVVLYRPSDPGSTLLPRS